MEGGLTLHMCDGYTYMHAYVHAYMHSYINTVHYDKYNKTKRGEGPTPQHLPARALPCHTCTTCPTRPTQAAESEAEARAK